MDTLKPGSNNTIVHLPDASPKPKTNPKPEGDLEIFHDSFKVRLSDLPKSRELIQITECTSCFDNFTVPVTERSVSGQYCGLCFLQTFPSKLSSPDLILKEKHRNEIISGHEIAFCPCDGEVYLYKKINLSNPELVKHDTPYQPDEIVECGRSVNKKIALDNMSDHNRIEHGIGKEPQTLIASNLSPRDPSALKAVVHYSVIEMIREKKTKVSDEPGSSGARAIPPSNENRQPGLSAICLKQNHDSSCMELFESLSDGKQRKIINVLSKCSEENELFCKLEDVFTDKKNCYIPTDNIKKIIDNKEALLKEIYPDLSKVEPDNVSTNSRNMETSRKGLNSDSSAILEHFDRYAPFHFTKDKYLKDPISFRHPDPRMRETLNNFYKQLTPYNVQVLDCLYNRFLKNYGSNIEMLSDFVVKEITLKSLLDNCKLLNIPFAANVIIEEQTSAVADIGGGQKVVRYAKKEVPTENRELQNMLSNISLIETIKTKKYHDAIIAFLEGMCESCSNTHDFQILLFHNFCDKADWDAFLNSKKLDTSKGMVYKIFGQMVQQGRSFREIFDIAYIDMEHRCMSFFLEEKL